MTTTSQVALIDRHLIKLAAFTLCVSFTLAASGLAHERGDGKHGAEISGTDGMDIEVALKPLVTGSGLGGEARLDVHNKPEHERFAPCT